MTLPVIILICVAISICYSFYELKKLGGKSESTDGRGIRNEGASNQPALSSANNPADALINSPYYSNYTAAFDLIWYDEKQPKYKIDWLLQSLNMGRELEHNGNYVLDSMRKKLPYFCETEYEYDYFFNVNKPVLRGSIDGMMDLGFLYSETNKYYSHPAKRKYWQQRLCELTLEGNLEAQGALCSNYARRVFSEEEVERFKEKYRANLIQLAEAGRSTAQLAVGGFIAPYNSQESIVWLTKAAQQGLSDAWYRLGKIYQAAAYLDDESQIKNISTQEAEKLYLEEKIVECFMRGAEADNGVMAAWCQYMLGDYYMDGDSVLPKDFEKAKYWFQKSLENGEERAGYSLDSLRQHPERY